MIAGDYYECRLVQALAQSLSGKQRPLNEMGAPKREAAIIKEWFGSTGDNLYLNRQGLVVMGSTSIWEAFPT